MVASFLESFVPSLSDLSHRADDDMAEGLDALGTAALRVGVDRACLNPPIEAAAAVRTARHCAELMQVRMAHLTNPPVLGSREHASMTGHATVSLRPIESADLPHLYRAAMQPENAHRWRFGGMTLSQQEFANSLHAGALSTLAAADESGIIGLLSAYNARLAHGTLYIAFLRADATRSPYAMFEAMFHFIEHVFRTWNVRKVYAEMPEFNYRPLLGSSAELFQLEGNLTGHSFFNGTFHDELLLALKPDSWKRYADVWRPYLA